MNGPLLLLAALLGCAGSGALAPTTPDDADGDGHGPAVDCDDADPLRFPGAPEACNGLDDDCDGQVDEGYDLDGDGFLTALDPGCAALGALDCDDRDPAVFPGAEERCNGIDDDCDGALDPLDDADADGFPICEDCDDGDASVRPGAPELCDGKDNDCNGGSDEPFDGDGDGWGDCLDCDDADPVAHPAAVEVCDGVDNDCDGERDEGFDLDGDGFTTCRGDCDDAEPAANPWGVESCNGVDDDCNGLVDDTEDLDGDGFFPCALVDPDCDDLDPDVYPGAPEICDGADNDCDGYTPPDEVDLDGDLVLVCAGDCDDADPERAAGVAEVCDGLDNDCDPLTDETVDGDGDGLSVCDGDCDDGEPLAFPGGTEVCNGVDDDCDGIVDNGGVCGPCEARSWGGHTYLFCDLALPWTDAHQGCLDAGYDLVAINDAAEASWVSDGAGAVYDGTWWSGFNDRAVEGTWAWSNGDPVTYTDWSPGEPNNVGGEDCAQLRWSGDQWNDIACTSALRFVCESL